MKGLALNKPAPPPARTEESLAGGQGQTAQLEIGIEYKLDLKREDLEVLKELGHGNGGTVSKVKHTATGTIMARKVSSAEPLARHMLTYLTGHTRRGEERYTEANCPRTSHHA